MFLYLDTAGDNIETKANFKYFNVDPTTFSETAEIPSASLEVKELPLKLKEKFVTKMTFSPFLDNHK